MSMSQVYFFVPVERPSHLGLLCFGRKRCFADLFSRCNAFLYTKKEGRCVVLIKESFWVGLESDALQLEKVEKFQNEQQILHAIAYRNGATIRDIMDSLKVVTVSDLEQLYEELYFFETADGGGEFDYDLANSH